jgi:hypothetical protein
VRTRLSPSRSSSVRQEAPLPLPWREVNSRESQRVAELIELPKRERSERRKWGCPFCGSSDALHAYPGPGAGFSCWSACGASRPKGCRGYSNADIAAAHWRVSAEEGCRRLAALFGVRCEEPVSRHHRRWRTPARADVPAPVSRQETNLAALERLPGARLPPEVYRDILRVIRLSQRGRRYLGGRHLDPAVSAEYGFRSIDGPDDWRILAEHLMRRYRPEELAAAGFPKSETGEAPIVLPFGGRLPALVIPFWRAGEIVGVRMRNVLPNDPRYKHNRYRTLAAAKPPWPYNADAFDSSTLHVCEGELNAETLRQLGESAIGVYGAGIWLDPWTAALADAEEVVDWHDATDPRRAGDRGAEALRQRLVAAYGEEWTRRRWRRMVTAADPNALHQAGRLVRILRGRPWRGAAEPNVLV